MQFTVKEGKKKLKEKLGILYRRAEIVFANYGDVLSFDVANVLMHATDRGEKKIKEVLDLLEEHFDKHLAYQHPDIRGTVYNSLGINETQAMFLNICKEVLGLKPAEEQKIPSEPFIVRTRNSVYRFGKADSEGSRSVLRDEKPLDFSECKIKYLMIGDSMVLDYFEEGWELTTSSVKSIEI